MKVLVCGGAGFMGRVIALEALRRGHEVHCTYRSGHDRSAPGIAWHGAELTSLGTVGALLDGIRPDVVVNAAAGPHRPTTEREVSASLEDSVGVTTTLLQAAGGSACRIVQLASSHEGTAGPDGMLRTTRGRHKAAATRAVRRWAGDHPGRVSILRPSSVYGPGEPADRVVPTLLSSISTGTPFRVSDAARDFVFVADVAEAVVMAVESTSDLEVDIGTGRPTTIKELARIADATVGPVELADVPFPPRPGDETTFVADTGPALQALGWRATTTLADGLRMTNESLRC